MESGELVLSVLTFIAIVVALIVGIISVRGTRHIQEREFKHRLLDDIVAWATKVINWRPENRLVLREVGDTQDFLANMRIIHAHIAEVEDFFVGITGLNVYIGNIARKLKKGLPAAVEKLIGDLNTYTQFLAEWRSTLAVKIENDSVDVSVDMGENSKKADELARQVERSASAVLVEVANMKAIDIG